MNSVYDIQSDQMVDPGGLSCRMNVDPFVLRGAHERNIALVRKADDYDNDRIFAVIHDGFYGAHPTILAEVLVGDPGQGGLMAFHAYPGLWDILRATAMDACQRLDHRSFDRGVQHGERKARAEIREALGIDGLFSGGAVGKQKRKYVRVDVALAKHLLDQGKSQAAVAREMGVSYLGLRAALARVSGGAKGGHGVKGPKGRIGGHVMSRPVSSLDLIPEAA